MNQMDLKWTDLPDAIKKAAARWQVEFEHGENPCPDIYEQFQAWLDADPRHAFAYRAVQGMIDGIIAYAVSLGLRLAPPRQS